MIRRVLAFALWLAAAGAAAAQGTVYRCGNAYSLAPCAEAKVVETESSARSEAQRAEAMRIAASEKQLADDMARDRQRAEARLRPAGAGSLGPARPSAAANGKAAPAGKGKKKDKGKTGEGEDFVAVVPATKP